MHGVSNETPTPGRLELKYCVPERVARQVLGVARGYLARDPLAREPRQRITSLYLDTPDLTFLRWHLDGATDRYKLRIRSYGEPPAATFYAETKRKTASVVRKEREAISAEALDAVIERYRVRLGATPRTLVRGFRESLRDPAGETAVTVDRALQYQSTRSADLIGDGRRWIALPLPPCSGPSPVLVELKYGDAAPTWMDALIRTLAPARVSFSKYVAAMTSWPGTRSVRPHVHINPDFGLHPVGARS